jgi:uncharacterized sulfatase
MDPAVRDTTNNSAVFSALDLNRSLYTIAGAEPPPDAELDGEDVASTILGRATASRRAPLFWRRPPDRPGFGHGLDEDNPDLAVRDGKWKFLVNLDGTSPQLYDLEADPAESQNLASQFPETAGRLEDALRAWNASMPQDASSPGR